VVLNSAEIIPADAVDNELSHAGVEAGPPTGDSLSTATELHLRRYFTAHGGSLPARGLYDRVLREVERPLISLSLEATRGNQIRAAELLGLNRNTLRKKIRELDIQVVRDLK
jgi:two-component system nitrogen regulation response regulator GlnG